jgi:hypothetical protein
VNTAPKKPYHTPRLHDFGDVRDVTQAATTNILNPVDAGGTPPQVYAS